MAPPLSLLDGFQLPLEGGRLLLSEKRLWALAAAPIGFSLLAFAVAASLLFFWGNVQLMMLGTLVGLSVLAYWIHLVGSYRKLLLDSMASGESAGDQAETTEDDDSLDSDA